MKKLLLFSLLTCSITQLNAMDSNEDDSLSNKRKSGKKEEKEINVLFKVLCGSNINKKFPNSQSIIDNLSKISKDEINDQDDKGNTLAHLLFSCHIKDVTTHYPSYYRSEVICRRMLQIMKNKGININLPNNQGDTVAHALIHNLKGKYDTYNMTDYSNKQEKIDNGWLLPYLVVLYDFGADFTLINNDGYTPYSLAVTYKARATAEVIRTYYEEQTRKKLFLELNERIITLQTMIKNLIAADLTKQEIK